MNIRITTTCASPLQEAILRECEEAERLRAELDDIIGPPSSDGAGAEEWTGGDR